MKSKISRENRLYQLDVPLYAITGSIGTGKSTVAHYLKGRRHPCLDADELIKLIYQKSETREFIAALDPHFVSGDQVNFNRLRQSFFHDEKIKEKIQSYLYSRMEGQFFNELKKFENLKYLFYDIPLLFENSLQDKFDCTIAVYCPRGEQVKRIVQRDKISPDLAEKIIAAQMDIEQKRRLSDHVLKNTSSREALYRQVDALLDMGDFP